MDTNDKLGLIERVNHASEDQAKRTLRAMILRCNVGQPTIARAIKDAIERHTPTPMIVYQQPESEDDDETALTLSHKRSKKKKNGQDGSSQDDGDVSASISKKRRSTRRGDINADPLVGQLILSKTKTKLKSNTKRSSDHNEEQNNSHSSKKNQYKHASKLRAEPEQRTCDNSMGEPSQQKSPTVIDLVTSSDDETCDSEHSENENLDDKSSHDAASDNENSDDSSDDESSDNDRSDDERDNDRSDDESSDNEQQDLALSEGVGSSRDGSRKKATQASASSDGDGLDAAKSITISMAKASIQNGSIKMSPLILSKKRKAPEHSAEDVHNDPAGQTATDTQANKRAKRNQPQEHHVSLNTQTCRNCGVPFPSMGQLLNHQLHCKSATATALGPPRSVMPWARQPSKFKTSHTADTSANYNATGEAGDPPQLPVHPNGGAQLAQVMSARRHGFDISPTNDYMDPNRDPARWDSKANAPLSDLSPRHASSVGAKSVPGLVPRYQPESHDTVSLKKLQSLMQRVYNCKRCHKYYDPSHNEVGDCQKGHSGMYRRRLAPRDGKPPAKYYTWSCCGQGDRNAPPCNSRKAVKHKSMGKVSMTQYKNSAGLRKYMQRFL